MYVTRASRFTGVLLVAFFASKWTPSFAQLKAPSFVKTITLKVEGEEECVRTSEYTKSESGPCKDYGRCCQYRCGAIARHCSECGEYKGPCVDYSEGEEASNARKKRSQESEENEEEHESMTSSMTNFMESISSRMRRLVQRVRAAVQTVPSPQTVTIETIGNLIVHLRAGLQNCTGFLTAVDGTEGKSYIILTAAQCLIDYETECYSGAQTFGEKFKANETSGEIIAGFTMYPYKHSWPCFGDYDADITRVKKGFRSYAVIVTSYIGRSYTIPLDNHHVIVPRDYMECQDCRYDYAAIKLDRDSAREILRQNDPFILAPDKDPIEWTGEEVTQFVSVKPNFAPELLRKAADTKFCSINYATKEKMCFHLPIAPNQESPDLLPGSPLFLPLINRQGETKYHCIGIFTGMYTTAQAVMSTEKLMEDTLDPMPEGSHISVDIKYSKNGAVRITQNFISLLEKFSGNPLMNSTSENSTGLIPQVFPPRRDCFPNVAQPYNGTEHLFLCSLGWKDEKTGCNQPHVKVSQGCSWNAPTFKCDPRIKRSQFTSGDPQESIFQQIVIPGTTKHLSFRGQRISDVIELSSALSRLPFLLDLILDYNDIEVLGSLLFSHNRELQMISLKYNKISRLPSDIFRYNKKLRHINLSHNHITAIPCDLLAKTAILQYLNLESNNIHFMSQKVFIRCPRMEQIYVGSNNISFFNFKLLGNLNELREFRFNNNTLRRISRLTFMDNPKLSLLDLSHNNLTGVPKYSFDRNLELRYVNLNYNHITVLSRKVFIHQRNLISVSATQNPLLNPNKTRVLFESAGIPYN